MKKGNSGFSAFLRRLDFLRGVGRLVAGLALIVVAAGLVQQTAHAQELLELDRLPNRTNEMVKGYEAFLIGPSPRAFAVGGSAWGSGVARNYNETREQVSERALEGCSKHAKPETPCRLYAVDLTVVHDGKVAGPLDAPPGPEYAPFTPMKGHFLRGPQASKGVIVWSHGRGSDDGRRYPSHPYIRLLNNGGWDVYMFGRHPNDDSLQIGVAGIRRGMAAIKDSGYKKIVLAGQSRGGWQSLTALAGPIHPFAVLAAAPAAHGSTGSMNLMAQLDQFKSLLDAANNPSVRVGMFLFDKDDFDEDVNKRTNWTRDVLGGKGNPLMLISKPDGITGHGGGNNRLFTERYGQCLVQFLEAEVLPSPFQCP